MIRDNNHTYKNNEAFAKFPFSTNHMHQSPEVHHTPPITIPDLTTALEA